jgi:HEAT repeat protein
MAALGIIDCGSALAVLTRLTELLVDRCKAARVGAVRAIGQVSADAAPLLRLKVLVGDEEPEVIGECCAALFNLEGASAVEFVAKLLESDAADVREEAALALGESRQPAALEPLRNCWLAQRTAPTRCTLLTAIALLRLPAANEFLLELIRNGSSGAPDALRALAWYRSVPNVRQQIEAAVQESQNAGLVRLFQSEF